MSALHSHFTRLFSATLLAGALCGGFTLPAQGPPSPADHGAEAPAGDGTRDTARFFLLQRMREELQLTDSQSLKVLDLLRAMDGERRTHRETAGALIQKIRSLQEAEGSTDAQFRDQVSLFQKEQARFDARLRELEQRVLDILTPRQQAGFLVMKRNLVNRGSRGAGPGQSDPQRRRAGRGRNRP